MVNRISWRTQPAGFASYHQNSPLPRIKLKVMNVLSMLEFRRNEQEGDAADCPGKALWAVPSRQAGCLVETRGTTDSGGGRERSLFDHPPARDRKSKKQNQTPEHRPNSLWPPMMWIKAIPSRSEPSLRTFPLAVIPMAAIFGVTMPPRLPAPPIRNTSAPTTSSHAYFRVVATE